jgi:hypothetical protein
VLLVHGPLAFHQIAFPVAKGFPLINGCWSLFNSSAG